MSTALDPSGNAVPVGRTRIRTPGLSGSVQVLVPVPNQDVRAQGDGSSAAFAAALASQDLRAQQTIEIAGAREVPGPVGARVRATRRGEPAIELEVPTPGEGYGQAVIAVDEAGVVTWNLPLPSATPAGATRGAQTSTYRIRRYVPPREGDGASRGLVSTLAKKVLKVVVFPLAEHLVGVAADRLAEHWEAAHRPYQLRTFMPGAHRAPATGESLDWATLGAGRALLFVHGTFSRAHTAFGRLGDDALAGLHERYGNRVFAFDHPTLSADPRENVQWLVNAIPDGTRLELDVVCHSRGGLVTRVLTERLGEIGLGARSLTVGRAVFVAAPSAGTALADADHLGDLVDRYSTMLNLFPDNGVTEVFEAVITVVKTLAVGVVGGLTGISPMAPGGDFLTGWLNQGSAVDTRYFALAADFEPGSAGLKAFVRDGLMDRVFGDARNDLVVPTASAFEANGSGAFPIADKLVFSATAGMQHSGFFGNADVQARLDSWLAPI